MRCAAVRKELTAFVDGELSPRRTARVQNHAEACAACSADLARISRVVAAEQTALRVRLPELSPDFEVKLRRRLATAEEPEPLSWHQAWWWKPVLVGGMAITAVLLAAAPLGGPSVVLVPLGIQAPPAKIAKEPDLFQEYEIIEHLDELEHFDTVDTMPLEEDLTGVSKGSA